MMMVREMRITMMIRTVMIMIGITNIICNEVCDDDDANSNDDNEEA